MLAPIEAFPCAKTTSTSKGYVPVVLILLGFSVNPIVKFVAEPGDTPKQLAALTELVRMSLTPSKPAESLPFTLAPDRKGLAVEPLGLKVHEVEPLFVMASMNPPEDVTTVESAKSIHVAKPAISEGKNVSKALFLGP
jgi:hypothetical protein